LWRKSRSLTACIEVFCILYAVIEPVKHIDVMKNSVVNRLMFALAAMVLVFGAWVQNAPARQISDAAKFKPSDLPVVLSREYNMGDVVPGVVVFKLEPDDVIRRYRVPDGSRGRERRQGSNPAGGVGAGVAGDANGDAAGAGVTGASSGGGAGASGAGAAGAPGVFGMRALEPSEVRYQVERILQSAGLVQMHQIMKDDALTEVQRDRRFRESGPGLGGNTALPDDLTRTFQARIAPHADPVEVAKRLSRLPGVAYAEPRVLHWLTSEPNDSLYGGPGQNYFQFQNIPAAWQVTTGSQEIVIAIVDSGVDYNHPDLATKLWRNPHPGRARELFPDIFAEVENDTIGWNFWNSGPIFNPVQNNDPMATASSHGTHVAGIAAAVTNNSIGVASAGYNSRYMAIKTGGTFEEPRAIGFGYEGILYAAVNGADVINCSFGSTFESQFGRDVVDFATSLGSLVVGAAGNTRAEGFFFPASYESVLGVTSVETGSGVVSNFSTFNTGLDVSATGRSLMSTIPGGRYAFNTGTSMSAPVVSGVAALLRHARPDWSPAQVHGQIRSAANPSIYNSNTEIHRYRLGRGLLDAGKALGMPLPSLRVLEATFVNNQGRKLRLDETGRIRLRIVNVGAPVVLARYEAEAAKGEVSLPGGGFGPIGSIATGDTITIEIPVYLGADADPRINPAVIVRFEDAAGTYSDFAWVEYRELFIDTHETNLVRMSFSSNGGIGYAIGGNPNTGAGFVPRVVEGGRIFDLPNVLYESGLMIMYQVDETQYLVDNVREQDMAPLNFRPLSLFAVDESEMGFSAGRALFDNSFASGTPGLEVEKKTFAVNETGLDQSVVVYFTVTNRDVEQRTFSDMYVGVYTDWDIGDYSKNSIVFNDSDSLMVVFSEVQDYPFVTVGHLGQIASALAIDNAYEGVPDSLNFGVYYTPGSNDPGFAEEYKRWSMVAGTRMTSRIDTDISMVTSSGPFTVRPGESITAGFVYSFGLSEEDLRSQVAAVRARQLLPVTSGFNQPSEPVFLPERTALVMNYPNPFNPTTNVVVDVKDPSVVRLMVYDVLGRRVAVLHDGWLDNRRYEFQFNAAGLASGVYYVVMQTDAINQTRPMMLLK
jgi:serine protease